MIQLAELRVRLDQMTERIVNRLKDRSRFQLNSTVYQPDHVSIASRTGISFLEYALEGLEAYHASLGRFAYPDQYPVFSAHLPESPVVRLIGTSPLLPLQMSIKDDLLTFYQRILPELCSPGDDPESYGETVYVDADLLQLINERVNIGRYVAQAKYDNDPGIIATLSDTQRLVERLRVPTREADLLRAARAAAQRYELNPALAERVFRWIIDETVAIEVEFLSRGHRATPSASSIQK